MPSEEAVTPILLSDPLLFSQNMFYGRGLFLQWYREEHNDRDAKTRIKHPISFFLSTVFFSAITVALLPIA